MFGPIRGPWPDMEWKGWWGDNPPYHVPVFVLTHYPRPPIPMARDTTFHFVTGGIHEALERTRAAAKGMDVRIGSGVATVRQYRRAELIDEMHLAIAPGAAPRGETLRFRRGGADVAWNRLLAITNVCRPLTLA
jgi:dihydrofolate reductase